MSGSGPVAPGGPGRNRPAVRSGRAVRRRTGEPPRPRLPQPALKLALLGAFVAAAAWIFSGDSSPEDTEESSEPAVESAEVLLPPSRRIVGEWRYILNDNETSDRRELEDKISKNGDDAISRAMLTQLEAKLADRLTVGATSLELRRAGSLSAWTWETTRESESELDLVLKSDTSSLRAQAKLEGKDWLELVVTVSDDQPGSTEQQRWRRVEPLGALKTTQPRTGEASDSSVAGEPTQESTRDP